MGLQNEDGAPGGRGVRIAAFSNLGIALKGLLMTVWSHTPPLPQPETHRLWDWAENSETVAPNGLLRGEGFIKDPITGIASSSSFYKLQSYLFQTMS